MASAPIVETGNTLGVFRVMDRLYMATVRCILKLSILCVSNNESIKLLSPLDADLGTTFMNQLVENRLVLDVKERIASRCLDFLKEFVKQNQLCLPASMEILCKLVLLCPKSVMSTINRPGVEDLPVYPISCPIDTVESRWRNVASASFSDYQDIDKFWLEVKMQEDTSVSRN